MSARISTGAALGLDLRNVGLVMSLGRSAAAALSAACTSRAAASMERDRLNSTQMLVLPSVLTEDTLVTPAILPRRRSSGAATVRAIVSGSAPGRPAVTLIEGSSTEGSPATGRLLCATKPSRRRPSASSVVPMGRRMKGCDSEKERPAPMAYSAASGTPAAAGRRRRPAMRARSFSMTR